MKISPAGLSFIKDWEKSNARAEDDGFGYLTIGYGHRVKPGEQFPAKITKAFALEILARDISWAEQAVDVLIREPLTQNQYDALVSLTFNIGATHFENSSVRTFINAGQFDKAAGCFRLWNKSKGVIAPGLITRRAQEKDIFLHGIYNSTH